MSLIVFVSLLLAQCESECVGVCSIITVACNSSQVLCAMLEYDVIESSDVKMQIITTLQTTPEGKQMYVQLCNQQIQLRELVGAYYI